MIPRVAKLGYGFAGAGLYYLHDKRPDSDKQALRPSAEDYHLLDKAGAQTSHRVGFTATRNLPTSDPRKALRCMQWLAANAHAVRQAAVAAAAKVAGMSYADYVKTTNPFRGRKGEKPLYSLSIAWHPTRNKKPSQQQMLAAADEVLRVLGLQDRQALFIEHKDTKHPHIHLIVNRVSPHNGLYAKVPNDFLTLSKWAMEFEKRTGQVLCFERVENWKRRDAARLSKADKRKANPKAKGEWVLARNVPRRDHHWFKSVAHLPADDIRQARAARQEREREQLTRKLADATLRLDGRLTRRYGLELAESERAIDNLKRAEYWRKKRDANSVALILAPKHAFHALVDLVSARKYFRPRRIRALQKTAETLRQTLANARRDFMTKRGMAWRQINSRHDAEKRRDEDRIAKLARAARGKGTADRARKIFNLRGAVETAGYFAPKQPVLTLSAVHAKALQRTEATRLAARHALSHVIAALGGSASAEQLRKQTVGGLPPPKERLAEIDPAVAESDRGAIPKTQSASQAQVDDRELSNDRAAGRHAPSPAVSAGEKRAFEARRDAAIERIETEQQVEKRRRRHRPRGKTRRM